MSSELLRARIECFSEEELAEAATASERWANKTASAEVGVNIPASRSHARKELRSNGLEILKSINENPHHPDPVMLQDVPFSIIPNFEERSFIYNHNAPSYPQMEYLAIPSDGSCMADHHWAHSISLGYAVDFNSLKYYAARGSLENKYATVTIFTPPGFDTTGGWVSDLGPFIFVNPEGQKNLPGRERGHSIHESGHRVLDISSPNVYARKIMPNPFLDEALAISFTLALCNARKNGPFDGLPDGNEASYIHQLNAQTLLGLMNFNQLNGEGVFRTDLYAQRMILATFLTNLAYGKALIDQDVVKEERPSTIVDQLKVSWRYTNEILVSLSGSRFEQRVFIPHILLAIKDDEQSKNDDLDTLFQRLFGYGVKQVEDEYLKHGTKSFLIHRMLHSNHRIFWWTYTPKMIKDKYSDLEPLVENLYYSVLGKELPSIIQGIDFS